MKSEEEKKKKIMLYCLDVQKKKDHLFVMMVIAKEYLSGLFVLVTSIYIWMDQTHI
jgi:hypothetical protein